jgi:cellobiose-specific phosphotransferase system component IIB
MKVMFFSGMTVSPGSGGGNTAYNLLEPNLPGNEVFYATPTNHPTHWSPFPQLSSRICSYENGARVVALRGDSRIKLIRKVNERFAKRNLERLTKSITEQLSEYIERANINILLLCPQSVVDLSVSKELASDTGLPYVVWFMDDYFYSNGASHLVNAVLKKARKCFVISEEMRRRFEENFGRESDVLNNSVDFPASYPEPAMRRGEPLRIAYTGALNSYYADVMKQVLHDLEGLAGRVEIDIYSHEELPFYLKNKQKTPWRHVKPVAAGDLVNTLHQYDVLLMLSSFLPEHKTIAETSLASKFADYLAAGRCILTYGPAYAENVKYAERYKLGVTVTSNTAGNLKDEVLKLLNEPEYRLQLGFHAFCFGKKTRDRNMNRQRLWQALSNAV